jgi:hypothetical protein
VEECPGIPLAWADDPLAIFTNYPWSRHSIKDSSLGYRFPTANYDGEEITGFDIHSTTCTGWSNNGDACSQCRQLAPKVKNPRQLSQQPPGRLNYRYQTHDQLTQSHRAKNQIIQNLKLSVNQIYLYSIVALTMIRRISIYLEISQSLRIILTLMIVLWLPFFLTRVLELIS